MTGSVLDKPHGFNKEGALFYGKWERLNSIGFNSDHQDFVYEFCHLSVPVNCLTPLMSVLSSVK